MIPRSRIASYPGMWSDIARGLVRPPPPDAARAFEVAIGEAVGAAHVVVTSTGRAALRLGLAAAGLPAGAEVLAPAYTHRSMIDAISAAGLTPRIVDVRPQDHNIDPERVEQATGPRTAALLVTHALGRACDMAALEDICRRRGLALLEDAAHAFGARFAGRPLGTWGRLGIFSFASTKPMQALGGGALVTDDPALARAVADAVAASGAPDSRAMARRVSSVALLQGVSSASDRSRLVGGAMRALYAAELDPLEVYRRLLRPGLSVGAEGSLGLAPLQGLIGARLLRHHPPLARARVRVEGALRARVAGRVHTLTPHPDSQSVPMALTLVPGDPDGLARRLLARGLDVSRDLVYDVSDGACPVAAHAARASLHVPVYPELDGRLQQLGDILDEALSG